MSGHECNHGKKSPYMLFNEVSRIVTRRFRKERDNMGMKEGYRHLIYHLSHGDDGATQQVLVAHTQLSAPTVSVSLGRMEKENIVRRYTDENDQRLVHVYLTPKGWDMVETLRKSHCDVERAFTEALTPEEFEKLGEMLAKIREKLDD